MTRFLKHVRGRRAGAFAVAAVSIATGLGPGAGMAVASAGPPVKYYVVHDHHRLQTAFLRLIATRTLGRADRYPEIFSLNQGRLQPDGKRLEKGSAIDAGWVLELPPDAHGPLVHQSLRPGTPSATQPSPTHPATAAPKPNQPARPVASAGSTGTSPLFGVALGTALAGPGIIAGVVTFLLTRRSRRANPSGEPDGDPEYWPAGPPFPAAAQGDGWPPARFRPGNEPQ